MSERRPSLKQALFARFALTATVPILAVFFFALIFTQRQVLDDAELKNGLLAKAVAGEVEDFLREPMSLLGQAATTMAEANPAAQPLQVDKILDEVVQNSHFFDAVYLLDKSGRVIAVGLGNSAEVLHEEHRGIDLSDNRFVMSSMKSGKPAWSGSYVSLSGGKPSLAACLPTPGGLIVGNFDIDLLNEVTKDKAGQDISVAVIDNTGTVISHTDRSIDGTGLNLSNLSSVAEGLSGRDSTREYNLKGTSYIGSVSPIRGPSWIVLVSQPLSIATAAVRNLFVIFLVGVALAIGGAVLLGGVQARKISAHFSELATAAEEVASGRYDEALGEFSYDEVQRLADSFQRMAFAVRDREKRLQDSLARHQLLFNRANDAIFVCGIDDEGHQGNFLEINDIACKMLGYSREELLKLTPLDVTASRDRANVREVGELLLSNVNYLLEKNMRAKDGREIPVEVHAHLFVLDGEMAALSVVRDISERKRSEAHIARLAAAVEQAAEDILISDSHGIIQYVNPAFEHTTGYSSEEAVGQKVQVLWSDKQDPSFYLEIVDTLRSGNNWQGRLTNRTKEGAEILYEASIASIRDGSGRVVAHVSACRNVTEQVKMEAHFAQSQKLEAIGTLAGGIAHDFNNILAAIIGYTELALSRDSSDPDFKEDLQTVLQASARAAELVRQILAFSRMSQEKAQPIQLKPIVKETIKLLRASIPTTIEIRQNVVSASMALADPSEIHRILVNLLTNSALAMREQGGTLFVRLEDVELDAFTAAKHPDVAPGRFLRLTVRDTGCGMPPEVKARIFEPFFTTRKNGEGTGMGLAVVHGIVKNRGGGISVASELGQGTTFEVFFPVARQEGKILTEGENEPLRGNERVLFVDDEAMVVRLTERMLGKLGYVVTGFTSSVEAVDAFRADPYAFDLVITDMTMPGMTGDVLAGTIKGIRPDMPIILCSGYSEKITSEKANNMAFDEFVMKPVMGAQLSRVIRKVLESA